MIKKIKEFIKGKKTAETRDYAGFSDFFLHAPADEKKRVITEAATRANEDQFRVFEEAQHKIKVG